MKHDTSPRSAAVSAAGSGGVSPPVQTSKRTISRHLISGFHSRGVLPHLKREGATYFVTFRQAGTLPGEVLVQLKRERQLIIEQAVAAERPLTWQEQEELFRWYSDRVDRYLDAGCGICHLRDPKCADVVGGALKFFDGQRYELHAWVVMPNHVHAVVRPMSPHSLSAILHSWKSYTAHELNKRLQKKIVPFWQSESYDHLIRDEDDLHRCCRDTLMNPVNAGLCAEPKLWRWSSGYVRLVTDGGTPSEPAGEDACAT